MYFNTQVMKLLLTGKKTNAVGSLGYVPTVFEKAKKLHGETYKKGRTTRRAQAAATIVQCQSERKQRKRNFKSLPLKQAIGRPTQIKPAEDYTDYPQAVWMSDHDYVKTQCWYGPMTELDYAKLRIQEMQNQKTKMSSQTILLNEMREEDFAVFTGLPNRAVFDAISDYLQKRGADKVCMQCFCGGNLLHFQLFYINMEKRDRND